MAAGINSAKINNSVIICTLSSVFKIHAGWDFPNLEVHALCWWSKTVNSLKREFQNLAQSSLQISTAMI